MQGWNEPNKENMAQRIMKKQHRPGFPMVGGVTQEMIPRKNPEKSETVINTSVSLIKQH